MGIFSNDRDLKALGTHTASGETNWMKIDKAQQLQAFLEVGTVSGTNPTLDVTIVESPDQAQEYLLHTFTQATATTKEKKSGEWPAKYIKVKWTIGGTDTPTFEFAVKSTIKENL